MNYFLKTIEISSNRIILLSSILLITFYNITFFSNVIDAYPVNLKNSIFLLSLVIVFGGAIVLLLSLVCHKYTIKPLLIGIFLISSSASYFMDSYNIVIDDTMIRNISHTNMEETLDLVTLKFIIYIVLLGIIPSILMYKINIKNTGFKNEIISRTKLFFTTFVLVASTIFIFGDYYASFFREHKSLRYYSNPSYYINSAVKYINGLTAIDDQPLKAIGADAKTSSIDKDRELIIFVLGETARSDRFSLNGYERETNPLLKKENVVNFSNFWACGTSTATSVPCIFSILNQDEYSDSKGKQNENLLDVLKHAGVNELWLDNNSDSKGVALRVSYVNYRLPDNNPICDIECRDEGMLSSLQTYINEHDKGDIFIVLHQMGNHGPAYYKRYTKEFERFTPTCNTNQLEDCSKEEIDNTYDNAILYTDYFLSKVISLLKNNDKTFESAMLYVSDHGESLGENGVYLHGMPNFIAPDTQLHVPAVMWFGSGFHDPMTASLISKKDTKFTHDNIFHTILGMLEVETSVYDRQMDIIHSN